MVESVILIFHPQVKINTVFYKKNDLVYTYNWTTEVVDPKLQGEPGLHEFNREEGWEMLYLINTFGKMHDVEIITVGNKIEKMVRFALPNAISTQKEVMDWLEENWSRH